MVVSTRIDASTVGPFKLARKRCSSTRNTALRNCEDAIWRVKHDKVNCHLWSVVLCPLVRTTCIWQHSYPRRCQYCQFLSDSETQALIAAIRVLRMLVVQIAPRSSNTAQNGPSNFFAIVVIRLMYVHRTAEMELSMPRAQHRKSTKQCRSKGQKKSIVQYPIA